MDSIGLSKINVVSSSAKTAKINRTTPDHKEIINTVSFKSNDSSNNEPGKNVFPAIASFFITGTGQMLNGETKKGFAMLGGALATGLVLGLAGLRKLVFPVALVIAIYSAVDAYRYNPKNKKQVG